MSNWETVLVKDIELNKPLPEGAYTFAVLGAKLNDRDPNRLDVTLAVTEGDQRGRRVFLDYPDPNRFAWVTKTIKLLEKAMGIDALPGENALTFLNRAASEGAKITAPVQHRQYTANDGTEKTAVEINRWQVGAAA